MSAVRLLSATLLSAASAFGLVAASGCGTEAVGVDACRDIELARCDAGPHCGLIEDAAACRRFYRDHCLHGLAAPAARGASVAACVNVIKAAGRCAAEDAESSLAACSEPVTSPQPGLQRACDVVSHPERASECAFLLPDDAPEATGGQPAADGAGGTAPAEGPAAGGAGGAAGDSVN